MASVPNQIARAQGYYSPIFHQLIGCITCLVDTKTGLVDANWLPSYVLTVPSDWTTGIYLAKFIDIMGMQTYVPFDVQGNFHSRYVVVTPDATYAAYNEWGGYSLYYGYNDSGICQSCRAVKVSFNRPDSVAYGSGQTLYIEADAIHWLEREGYDLSYMSNIDLHADPAQLLDHRAYISLGHDEYWTKEMRDGVEHARDEGVGIAFLGANDIYWQIRLEPDRAGITNRTVVCYRVSTANKSLASDPFYGKDNSRLTALWRDPILARPENALIGIMYSNLTHRQTGFPWQVNLLTNSPLLKGTGLQQGKSYGCGLVGNEWDNVFANGATPAGIQLIGLSHTVDNDGHADISSTTYYIAPSGAMVFATGSIYWTASLDSYRFYTDSLCSNQNPVVASMQKLMMHVMDALVIRHFH